MILNKSFVEAVASGFEHKESFFLKYD